MSRTAGKGIIYQVHLNPIKSDAEEKAWNIPGPEMVRMTKGDRKDRRFQFPDGAHITRII